MENQCRIGIIGLGVMGRNLALNLADHGFPAAGFDIDSAKTAALAQVARGKRISCAQSPAELARLLAKPRTVLLMVPAGSPVDAVLGRLMEVFDAGDIIMDGGNSYFKDTDLRAKAAGERGIRYFGVGISGGEEGARRGPSIMAGGPQEVWSAISPMLEGIAAKVGNEPCAGLLGPGSAGHYVKMVHNGIEYALLQLIAESYDLMKRGCGFTDQELHLLFTQWNENALGGYLIEITAAILQERDAKGGLLVDVILDEAKQKGTGKWTSQDAMDLQVPLPTVDAAVAARHMSIYKEERVKAAKLFSRYEQEWSGDRELLIMNVQNGLYASMIVAFGQCLALLQTASRHYGYGLRLEQIAGTWRGGCIIRSKLLEPIRQAFRKNPDLPNLLLDPHFSGEVGKRLAALGWIIDTASDLGIPVPAYMASLAYVDSYRSAWLPANLIQAQRDYFGAHTYERTDAKGTFHTEWQADLETEVASPAGKS